MTTKMKIEKRTAAELLAAIRRDMTQAGILKTKARKISMMLYANTYLYVEELLVLGKVKTSRMGIEALGEALQKNAATVSNWYYAGQFARDKSLDATKVDAAQVQFLTARRQVIPQAEMLRCLNIVRKGGRSQDISRIVAKSPAIAGHRGDVRTRQMKGLRTYNKTGMKLELMALATVLKQFYKCDLAIYVVDSNGKTLLETEVQAD